MRPSDVPGFCSRPADEAMPQVIDAIGRYGCPAPVVRYSTCQATRNQPGWVTSINFANSSLSRMPHPACDGPLIPSGEPHVTKWTPATTFTLACAGHERVVSSLYPHESQRDAYWGTRNLHLPTTYPSRAGEGLGSCALPARPPRCPGVVLLRAANSPRFGASRSPFW